jgi:hypothetical protein
MTPRGSFWIVATATPDGLVYERLEQALAWADAHDRAGTEPFIGVNGRSGEGKTKASVPTATCCFADLDLSDGSINDALAMLTSGCTPPPSFVVNSGYGLHECDQSFVGVFRGPEARKRQSNHVHESDLVLWYVAQAPSVSRRPDAGGAGRACWH